MCNMFILMTDLLLGDHLVDILDADESVLEWFGMSWTHLKGFLGIKHV